MCVRQSLTDTLRRLDEFDSIVVVLIDTRRDGEDIWIEDNILRREAYHFGEQFVGALANLELPVCRIGLTFLVEGHDDSSRTVAFHLTRLFEERGLALLEADRVDDGLALHAFEACLDNRPFG